MKKLLLLLLMSASLPVTAQETIRDSLMMAIYGEVANISDRISSRNRYKLYPTQNIYQFLQLDTKTGMIEQVQWNLDEDKEFSTSINDKDLSWGSGSGTFELYPTQNMYQFILLDKSNGRKWHVQWGMESSKRWIRRIF